MISKNDSKFIKSLKLKKYRSREGLFLVEGKKNVLELLGSNLEVQRLFGTDQLESVLEQRNWTGRFQKTSPKELEKVGSFQTNEFGLAIVKIPTEVPQGLKDGVIVALDGVADPGNLGTIIRAMDWFGYNQLVCSTDCADCYNPKTIAATMGSFCRIQAYYTDLPQFVEERASMRCYAMVLDGQSIYEAKLDDGIYLLGSESHGIRTGVTPISATQLTIPRFGQAESLNVAMASTLLLSTIRSS